METKYPVVPELDFAAYIGRRQARYTFELVDGVTGEHKGFLHPDVNSPPVITHDTSRTINRTVDSLTLDREDSALVDPVRDRVLVVMEINDVSYPLGRYMFTDSTAFETTAGRWINAQLMDEMFIVDQELDVGISFPLNATATAEIAMPQVMRPLSGVVTYEFEPSEFAIVGGWPAGTNRGQVTSAIALQGDYFNPWFDNTGVMKMIRAFDPADVIPSFNWDTTDHVLSTPVAYHNDLLMSPNRFVVVGNGGGDLNQSIVGTYDVSPDAPHSIQNRGFVITRTMSLQLSSPAQAFAVARNFATRQLVYERVDLTTPPDPRHDSYDVVFWNGDLWLELSWTLPLIEGSVMSHTMRKAY